MSVPLKITPVILAGGSGTRLWPLSRAGFPKQFLCLLERESLFQQSVLRLNDISASDLEVSETLIITNEEHRFLALEQLREISKISAKLLLEPVGRNTAPALTLAALQATSKGDDPILLVSPADQTIINKDAYIKAIQNSIRVAADGHIVILGVDPNKPEIGFGYIKKTGSSGQYNEYEVEQFVEKPDIDTATQYLSSGNFLWNSGIFILRASAWLNALNFFRPDILNATIQSFSKRNIDDNFIRPDKLLFEKIANDSIDYSVIEKCPRSSFSIKIIPLDAGWNDLGSWDAVWQNGVQDNEGNILYGDSMIEDTENTLVYASHRLVGVIGVSDLIIIETADAVLIADRNMSQHVKKIVNKLQSNNRQERSLHRKVSRPWGWYDSLEEGDRFKVKRIQVNPGASLSLQHHTKRAEHWVVVKGIASVECGSKSFILHENESTFIPLGEKHRLSNFGKEPLEIIEVQSGSYLGEDDIIRLGDNYGR